LAPRLKTSERGSRLIVAGLVALALLALGEQAPAAFPVHVTIEAHGAALQVSVDGQSHLLSSQLGGGWRGVALEQPGPAEREYQIDGSDTTATDDRDGAFITGLLSTPLYRVDAWLRDEGSYSRWEHLSVVDLSGGLTSSVAASSGSVGSGGSAGAGGSAGSGASGSPDGPLPNDFRVEVDLRRPEAPARVWLLGATADRREGLELDRDRRNARWLIQRGTGLDALPRWFFPEEPMPFVAELLQLMGRTAAAAYALAVLALALGALTRRVNPKGTTSVGETTSVWVGVAVLGVWLAASVYVSLRVFQQLPHILDAVSYTFQAGVFASGALGQLAPPVPDAFKGPFEVLWQERIFSQYPPGAAAVYALGAKATLEWLVGPLACAVLIGATAWSAATIYGKRAGLAALGLGVISPFILFQSGSYLSHPIAGMFVACALLAFVQAETRTDARWYAVTGALLGGAFLAREVAGVLFALPLGVRLVSKKRWGPLSQVVAFGLPFLVIYLLYNLRQTGSPFLLPRMLFNPTDHFGFGDGVGFHTRHTLAAGLANTDELLTILQFDLFGWPPLFALGLVSLPFLLGRAAAWDWLAAGGFLAFVVAYVCYFYHGIALGPRYYFEAMPWLLLLGARGLQALSHAARSRLAPVVLTGLLTLNTVFFYTSSEIDRRTDMTGLPGGVRIALAFVEQTPFGPRLNGVPDNALVLTDDWWMYNTTLAPLNCARLPACPVLFALATSPNDADRLHAQYPDRILMRAVDNRGVLEIQPY